MTASKSQFSPRRLFVFLMSSALYLVPATAVAQAGSGTTPPTSNAPDRPMPPDAPVGVPDIIVTAGRREQNLQAVPGTVVALSRDRLSAQGIKSTVDLPQLVPGLTVERSGGLVPYLRGVGSPNSGFTTEMPVAVYLDGLYLPNSASGLFSFNSIERIEVLKGPQGTLYGRNTTGGLINVITRDPGREPVAEASVGYGNYGTFSLNGYASTPLRDDLYANLAVTYSDQARGWGRNVTTGRSVFKERDVGIQGKLLFEPDDRTKVALRGFFDRDETDKGGAFAVLPGTIAVDGSTNAGRFNIASRRDPAGHVSQWNASLKIDRDLGFARLMSLTGLLGARSPYRVTQSGIAGNPVAGQGAIELDLYGRSWTVSQEMQLRSKASRLEWIAGLYYFSDDTTIRSEVYGTCIATTCAPTPIPTRVTSHPDTRSYSAYGEATYPLTPTTKTTLGLRYTSDHKTLSGFAEPLPGRPNSVRTLPATIVLHPGDPYAGSPAGIDTAVTFGKLTFKGVVAQTLAPRVNAYLSFNRGFKSGAYNPISFSNPPSRPEQLDAYEIGIKSDLFARLVQLNLAAFHYDYDDIQLRSTAPPAPPGGTILVNAAKARVNGFDADVSVAPTGGLRLFGNLEFLDGRYRDFPGGTCTAPRPIGGTFLGGTVVTPCDLSGRRLQQSPKLSYNAGVSYIMRTTIGDLELAANDAYRSRYHFGTDLRAEQRGYHLVGLSATWTSPSRHLNLQVFARNLTNAYYFTTIQRGVGGNDIELAAAPRTFGGSLGFRL